MCSASISGKAASQRYYSKTFPMATTDRKAQRANYLKPDNLHTVLRLNIKENKSKLVCLTAFKQFCIAYDDVFKLLNISFGII